jgi:dihydrolipoamide dehydrogenase
VPNIYVDVVRGAMLAHKAEEEGTMVAEHCWSKPHIDYNLIPVYTYGGRWTNRRAVKRSWNCIQTGSFPFKALGRARKC